ncbi:MAG: hypothetical protein IIT63_11330 [Prevotella sp.]|nr:hypothetical protein [Prevotella sp.]MBQ5456404.1 hypothetical protein [Prevotella sp.]
MEFILGIIFFLVTWRFCSKFTDEEIKKYGKDGAAKRAKERGRGIFY